MTDIGSESYVIIGPLLKAGYSKQGGKQSINQPLRGDLCDELPSISFKSIVCMVKQAYLSLMVNQNPCRNLNIRSLKKGGSYLAPVFILRYEARRAAG